MTRHVKHVSPCVSALTSTLAESHPGLPLPFRGPGRGEESEWGVRGELGSGVGGDDIWNISLALCFLLLVGLAATALEKVCAMRLKVCLEEGRQP